MRSWILWPPGAQGLRGSTHRSPKIRELGEPRANLERGSNTCPSTPPPPRRDLLNGKWHERLEMGERSPVSNPAHPLGHRSLWGPAPSLAFDLLATHQVGGNLAKKMILIHRNANTLSQVERALISTPWILTSSVSVPKFLGVSWAPGVTSYRFFSLNRKLHSIFDHPKRQKQPLGRALLW